jgi:hypothetical protein
MWAFLIEFDRKYGYYCPAGNSGQQKLNNKTPRGWYNELYSMRHSGNGIIYILPHFTQEMCEMKPSVFCDYVMKNYIHKMYTGK